ncbi:hypothetical protein UlMin_025280 [Ulmus minor]
MESILLKFVFPLPPSLFINSLSLINLPISVSNGLSEVRGKNLKYSKFWENSTKSSKKEQKWFSSRKGMLICYTPAFLASLGMFFIFPHGDVGMLLVSLALAFHFFKRLFEVLFIHNYSGSMDLDTTILISISYVSYSTSMIYAQHLSQSLVEPSIDLKYFGIIIFLIGIIGNFYHHYVLSLLRTKDSSVKEYRIPKGGLFGLVICPHYLFELLGFVGVSFISQTPHSFSIALGMIFYLMGRSYATRAWYVSKFEDFPKHVKALIPYVF